MLMSVIEGALSVPAYPELAGKRILVTGLTSNCGVDVVRAFAGHRCRLVLQFAESSEAMEAVAEIVAPDALDTAVYGPVAGATEDVAQFARGAVTAFGGVDAVVNLVALDTPDLGPATTLTEVERLVSAQLALPFLVSNIAANRMSMVLTEGLVLNVATLRRDVSSRAQAFASVAKATLTAMTRAQAEEWADRAIRFNAIAPETGLGPGFEGLTGETDIAAVALYLASGRGRGLSGCVFEAVAA